MHVDAGQSRKSPVSDGRTPAGGAVDEGQMSSVMLAGLSHTHIHTRTHKHTILQTLFTLFVLTEFDFPPRKAQRDCDHRLLQRSVCVSLA